MSSKLFFFNSYFQATIHLLNVLLPLVFAWLHDNPHFELVYSFILIAVASFIYTHCWGVLVNCSLILCKRFRVPSLGFTDVIATAFSSISPSFRVFSAFVRFMTGAAYLMYLAITISTHIGIISYQMKLCIHYLSTKTNNLEFFEDDDQAFNFDKRLQFLILTILILGPSLIKSLENLVPLSMLGLFSFIIANGIEFYIKYAVEGEMRNPAGAYTKTFNLSLAITFILAAANKGIWVMMSLENKMKFNGFASIITVCVIICAVTYSAVRLYVYYNPIDIDLSYISTPNNTQVNFLFK